MTGDLPTLSELQALGSVQAAAFWLERLEQEAPETEQALFQTWLIAEDANQTAWDRALELWDSFESGDPPPELETMRREALAFRPRRPAPTWLPYAAAACVAVAVGAFALSGYKPGPPLRESEIAAGGPDLSRIGQVDYETAVGQARTVALDDGSRLTLDTNSAVDVAYLADKRLVRLVRGQVFFEVAPNARKPFRVAAGERIVSVLGTRFNIRLATAETRVFLVEGSIAVSRGHDPAQPAAELERLSPGEELIVRPGRPDQIDRAADAAPLDWRQGLVRFDGQTLAAAVDELNRYSPRKLVIRDPKVAALRISGAFPTGDPDGFVQTLTALYPVRALSLPDGTVEITPRR